MRRVLIPLVIATLLSGAAPAEACDPTEAGARAARLQTHLDRERRRARRWDNAWLVTFATATVAQGSARLAEWTPLGDYDDDAEAGLEVGTVKGAVATLAHVVLRLKIVRPERTGDPCVDAEAAERAFRASARNERRSFYLNHLGSFAFNVGGMLYLGLREDAWGEAALSTGIGYPVGLLAVYTQPRGVWKAERRGGIEATIGVARRRDFTGLVLAGTF
jgi:hypothetical protein